jgi:hypothetical protein
MEGPQIRLTFISKIYGLLLIIPFLLFLACATTSGTTSKNPGKYSEWNGFIDELEIVNTFSINAYSKVVFLPVDTSAVMLPEKSENTYEPLAKMISLVDQTFQEGLTKGMKGLNNVSLESSKSRTSEAGVLIIRAKVFEMNPGSRALRYFVGFGAGKTVVGIQGEVIDALSGQVQLKFKHARASSMGGFGGDYEKFLSDDTRDVGEDIGKMLVKMQ